MDVWLIHGLLGCIALLLIFPLGIAKLWSKKSRWPIPHWAIQSTGLLVLMSTTALGLFKSSSLHDTHQALGLGVSGIVLVQAILGHANTLRDHPAATYITVAHSSLGFSTLILGWVTVLTGFRLASVASTTFIVVGLLSATEICALIAGSLVVRWRAQSTAGTTDHERDSFGPADGLYTLAGYDSEDDQGNTAYEDKASHGRQSSSTTRGPAAA